MYFYGKFKLSSSFCNAMYTLGWTRNSDSWKSDKLQLVSVSLRSVPWHSWKANRACQRIWGITHFVKWKILFQFDWIILPFQRDYLLISCTILCQDYEIRPQQLECKIPPLKNHNITKRYYSDLVNAKNIKPLEAEQSGQKLGNAKEKSEGKQCQQWQQQKRQYQ